MTSPYQRQKDPDRVRKLLLDCTASIASKQGLSAATVSAVSAAAGVTKGALFHHFVNKQALVDAMFNEMLGELDIAIDDLIAIDPESYGRFTRAYVRLALTMDDDVKGRWSLIISSIMERAELMSKWNVWLKERLERHVETDGDSMLEIVRIAADGAWLNSLSEQTEPPLIDVADIREKLLLMARPPSS
ncbi:TetR family transcriptional regulator [Pseudomonas syringae]|uniref:TetR/AcrR family transcriptional regulator n=1 Tax=Pseudomonas syringae TaxID=317 RepID=UPI003CE8F175